MTNTSPPPTPTESPTPVPARRFWVLIPVAAFLMVAFHFWWPDGPAVLRALVGTVALIVTATVVVLIDGRRHPG